MKRIVSLLQIEAVKYVVVGGITAIIYVGIFSMLTTGLGLEYRLGISLAYVAAVLFHYHMNRIYTFKAMSSSQIYQVSTYGLLLAVNYGINLLVAYLCITMAGMNPFFGAIIAMVSTVFTGYNVSKFIVFKVRGGIHE